MIHKHLHELLSEDQQPFQLKNYIADRRCKLRSTRPTVAGKPAIDDLRKHKQLTRNFCINHVCLFSFQDSPDVRRSPFLGFHSPAIQKPNNATVFLHVPERTATLLLEAAMRVQKQFKPKPESSRNVGFELLRSLFKRLKDRRSRVRRREIRLSSPPARRNEADLDAAGSSADWSEKSSELETSCSSWSVHDSDEIDKCLCSSPSSPFRFSLQKSPFSGNRTSDFPSPATSPAHHLEEDKEVHKTQESQEIHVEEEKEQCSPVSVFDPPFEDDEEEHDGDITEEGDYDLECSYASVQRTKQELLQKLRRFEKLAALDPIELEKHMSEQCYDDVDIEEYATNKVFLRDIFNHLGIVKVPSYMKRLVSDLVKEENKNVAEEHKVVVKRVCRRFESWKMVESNTIDMMVELDFRREKSEGWRRFDGKTITETGMDIEVAIFGGLVEELSREFVRF